MIYSRILVPLDGSKRSEAVLPEAESVARQCGATLILLEVLESLPPHAAVVAPDVLATGASQRAGEVKHYVERLAEEFRTRGVDARAVVRNGSVVETILATAEAEQVDLVAMASHAHTGLARVIYGSVAADVLHRARWPMLIVRADSEE
jgi:nucleotide-binding universal stress UspA family protein